MSGFGELIKCIISCSDFICFLYVFNFWKKYVILLVISINWSKNFGCWFIFIRAMICVSKIEHKDTISWLSSVEIMSKIRVSKFVLKGKDNNSW